MLNNKGWHNTITLTAILAGMLILNSCSLFKARYGCKTNGKNIGAERLMSGDKEAEKAARKAKKFKS